ncbi:MAG: phage tail tape measure protein [Bacillota bacterium]
MSSLGTIWASLALDLTKFDANMRQVESSIKTAEKNLEGFEKAGDRLTSMGKKLSLAVTLPILAIGTAATKMAMDAVESENLFEVSMGNMASTARAWSEEVSDALGLNEYEIRKSVGTYNVMLNSMGLGEQAAYDMAKGLTQLAYDMASFYNLPVEEAFLKIQSGISGEIEPLKRLGIVVNETTVQTYAYTHGIAEQGDELTEEEKILARYGVIMDATGKAQGDLARTIDSPSNQLRILKSRISEAGVELGEKFLPTLQKVFAAALDLVEGFQDLPPGVQNVILVMAGLAAALGPVLFAAGLVAKTIVGVHAAAALLGPVISGLSVKFGLHAASATAAGTGTAAAGTAAAVATPFVTGLGAAFKIATGPIGLVVAALGLFTWWAVDATKKARENGMQIEGMADQWTYMRDQIEQDISLPVGMTELPEELMNLYNGASTATKGIAGFSTKIKTLPPDIDPATKAAAALAAQAAALAKHLEGLQSAVSSLGIDLDISKVRFERLTAGFDPLNDKAVILTATLNFQREQLGLVEQRIGALSDAYQYLAATKGADNEETKKTLLDLEQEKLKRDDLTRSIAGNTTALQLQNDAQAKTLTMIGEQQTRLLAAGDITGALALQEVLMPGYKAPKASDEQTGPQHVGLTGAWESLKQRYSGYTTDALKSMYRFFYGHEAPIGMAGGGVLYEPVMGMGLRSGSRYTFAETGPEEFGGVGKVGKTGDGPVYINVELDGRVIAKAVLPHIHRQLVLKAGL